MSASFELTCKISVPLGAVSLTSPVYGKLEKIGGSSLTSLTDALIMVVAVIGNGKFSRACTIKSYSVVVSASSRPLTTTVPSELTLNGRPRGGFSKLKTIGLES